MYLYESVFSGTVLGYTYSRVLPVDHQVSPGGNRLGPQIRDFEKVVDEGTVNVGIAPLSSEQRRFVESKLKTNPNLLLDLYHKYKDYGYPIKNLLSVVSAASENLRHELNLIGDLASKVIGHHEPKKDTVFCSELVSIVYKEFGLPTFIASPPETFTPLEVEVAHEFDQTIFYAKENGVSLMKHNRVKTGAISTQAEKLIKSLAMSSNWVAVKSGIPEGAQPAGEDVNGKKLFIARVKIGSAYYLGKIREDWSFPLVTYYEREVPINFGHEVLANLTGMKWVDASHGDVPGGAVKAGIEEDGSYLYISRAIVGDSHGILGVGKKAGAYAPGTVAKHLKNARIPFGGKEVKVEHYQVLCHD
ncbi:hypothetical protein BC830DRAFT_1148817 [Chytriomyces sp. MP71]|nr:hypothetical protein BC830DRAFT_1148817 [Chytriomyces sp. MP71]